MENITEVFTEVYVPTKALIIYQSEKEDEHVYVEAYDMNKAGKPINAHPLSLQETIHLANCLNVSAELNSSFTQSKGLLPDNVLYLNASNQGCVIWYTPAQQVRLLFTESLGIPSGGSIRAAACLESRQGRPAPVRGQKQGQAGHANAPVPRPILQYVCQWRRMHGNGRY